MALVGLREGPHTGEVASGHLAVVLIGAAGLLFGACASPSVRVAPTSTPPATRSASASATASPARTFDRPDATRLPEPQAWAAVRAAVPKDITIWRPQWLPDRFNRTIAGIDYALGPDWRYAMTYGASAGDFVTFALGAVNTGQPRTVEMVSVHGVSGTLALSDQAPHTQLFWHEGSRLYTVFSNSLTRDEVLRIVQEATAN